MEEKKKIKYFVLEKADICSIIIGVALVLFGLMIQVPGGALTTYAFMDGEGTEVYTFDNKYSAIDEYVGGDAYNYIIGAALVAGKMAGRMTAKAICVVGGLLCVCLGMTTRMMRKKLTLANDNNAEQMGAVQKLDVSKESELKTENDKVVPQVESEAEK